MLVDSPYVGDWMASTYTSRGRRIDYHRFLSPDGSFERITREEPANEHVDRGRWHHKEGDEIMGFVSEAPNEIDRITSNWCVLSVKTCEESNCLMVLRWD